MAAVPLPDAEQFESMKRQIFAALCHAIESVAFAFYYPNADLTLQIRDGQIVRTDVREIRIH